MRSRGLSRRGPFVRTGKGQIEYNHMPFRGGVIASILVSTTRSEK